MAQDMGNIIVVLMSGGIDSTACAHYLQQSDDHIEGLFIEYGQLAVTQEKAAAFNIAKLLQLPLKSVLVNFQSHYAVGDLVARNAFFIFAAMMKHQLREGALALGIHAGTNYYDCTPAFIDSTARLVSEYTDGRVRILAPFLSWHKKDVFDYFKTTGLPVDLTYSCEAGAVPTCGDCSSCRDRRMLGCNS